MEDLVGEAKYLVNMKVEVCLEKDQPCMISQDIAKDLYLPKPGCDWSLDFSSEFMWDFTILIVPLSLLVNEISDFDSCPALYSCKLSIII